jgi:hypothetical protein
MGDYVVPAMMMVAQGGMSYLQGNQQSNRADDAREDSQDFYNQQQVNERAYYDEQNTAQQAYYAKQQADQRAYYDQVSLPNSAAVNAAAVQNRGQLGQARLSAQQSLGKNLAARGFGSGSGLGIKGATDIESAYIKGIGQSQTELTKFANTRQFSPTTLQPPGLRFAGQQPLGSDVYGYSVPGGGESALGSGSNMLNTATGMYMANKMLGGGGGGGSSPAVPATAYTAGGVTQRPGTDYDWNTGNRY